MKRRLTLIGLFILVLTFSSVVFANEVTINENNLNVRNGPGQSYDIIGQVHKDSEYPIISTQGDWIEIELENSTGWVYKEFVTTDEGIMDDVHASKVITIQADHTHLRSGPSTEYDIIYYAKKGEEFTILKESSEWLQIENEQITGYVLKSLLHPPNSHNSSSMTGKTVVIDPGHGGRDVGAIGANETYEKDLTYKTSIALAEKLTTLGVNVILTREHDGFLSLGSRVAVSNNLDADAFVSLHYNSTPELPNVTGIGTYYYQEHNKDLADFVQQELVKQTGDRDRGSTFGDFQVIRQSVKPAILIELGFISNEEREQLLLTNIYQQKLVNGIVNGLTKYFNYH